MAASVLNVLVTGSSRGIGRAVALAFGRAGHRVTVHCRSRLEQAREVAAEVVRAGGEAEARQADLADPAQARKLVDDAAAKWGSLHVLVNNAGVARDRTILKMTEAEWREVIDVNLSGVFWCLKAAAAHMARQKEGCILNVSSLAGLRGAFGIANYAAAKAGVAALTKTAARELGRFNVRVNAVLPGFHRTEMNDALWEKGRDKILEEHVLGRLADADELGDFVVALSKLKSVSGQVIPFESRVA
ncbi:MAG: SDR family NAD(P)-dependent oxidoreductase [Elusimicrobiota bacterium]